MTNHRSDAVDGKKGNGAPSNKTTGTESNLCASCILSKSIAQLEFSEAGVCQLCQMDMNREEERNIPIQDIEQKIQEVRQLGKSRQYDCLVGVSGGRDSSYLLYLLVKKHNLRCLAAFYPTPFTDKVIEDNVYRMVKKLDVPLVKMDISHNYHKSFVKKILALWQKNPCPELINLLCVPCKYVNREAFKIARQHNIKTIIFGGSKYESFQFGATDNTKQLEKDILGLKSQFKKVVAIAKRGVSLAIKLPALTPLLPACFKASALYLNPHTPYLKIRYSDIVRLDYFFYEPEDEAECSRVITSELGWKLPPGCYSYWRADCSLADVKNLLFRRIMGVSYMDAYLSNMIRDGAITRDQALERLETEGQVSQYRLEHVTRILNLEADFFEKLKKL